MSDFESRCKEMFEQAVVLPPTDRSAFLERACADIELRRRVENLLRSHDKAAGFLEMPALEVFPTLGDHPGPQLDEFRILREIGRGGMGTVYLAVDTELKRAVAIKVLSPALAGELGFERFRREAQAAARLAHSGIVQVYRTGQDRGHFYIAMEFVDGKTLRAMLAAPESETRPAAARDPASAADSPRRVPTEAEVGQYAALLAEVADALEHAHQRGVIHRDVKPGNILIDGEGRARLADFGIARIVADETLTADGTVAGSIAYMSPEQARASHIEIDHRSDIFSLGVVLYECLTGVRPFDGRTPMDVFKALQEGKPRAVRRRNPSVSLDLATICHKAIEQEPARRYPTAAHFAADLRAFLNRRPILATPPSLGHRARRFVIRHRTALVLSALVGLLGMTMGIVAVQRARLRAQMGHVAIGDVHAGWDVEVRKFTTENQLGSVVSTGRAPVEFDLPPGLYRVILSGSDGKRLETSSLLTSGTVDRIALRSAEPASITGLVAFSANDYSLGDAGSNYSLTKTRTVRLDAFLISRTEVSNREYREFVVATAAAPPKTWTDPYDPQCDNLPVCDISWEDANRYCRWRGVRLPTPDEWEAAARGASGRRYPWGEDPHADLERLELEDDLTEYKLAVQPVNSQPQFAGPEGILHLLSNVQEYTEGIAADRNNGVIVKGRSWRNAPYRRPAQMYVLSSSQVTSTDRGFRIAMSHRSED